MPCPQSGISRHNIQCDGQIEIRVSPSTDRLAPLVRSTDDDDDDEMTTDDDDDDDGALPFLWSTMVLSCWSVLVSIILSASASITTTGVSGW